MVYSERDATQKDTSSSAVTSSLSHTPGPWDLTTRRGSWDWVVFQAANPNIEICQPFHDGTEDNELGEANARLIAAAPDLLAALKGAQRIVERDFPNGTVAVDIRAAISKATSPASSPQSDLT